MDELYKSLKPYVQFEPLHKVLLSREGQDQLSSSFCESFRTAVLNLSSLKSFPDQLDGPLYKLRYSQLLQQAVKSLLNSVMDELDLVTRLSSSRFRDSAALSVLADVNADYLVTCSKLSGSVQALGSCGDQHREEYSNHILCPLFY